MIPPAVSSAADRILAKMHDAHSVCRRLPSWSVDIPKWQQVIRERAKRDGETHWMTTVCKLVKELEDNPAAIMWLLAAATERCLQEENLHD